MDNIAQYLRDEAGRFRDMSRFNNDPNVRRKLFALAKQCEDIALEIEDGPVYKRNTGR